MSEIRIRLAKRLQELGVDVKWYDFDPAKGYWRKKQQDVLTWTAEAIVDGRRVIIGSWETMRACSRKGLTIQKTHTTSGYIEVFAAETKSSPSHRKR